jgi:hypothetical protein
MKWLDRIWGRYILSRVSEYLERQRDQYSYWGATYRKVFTEEEEILNQENNRRFDSLIHAENIVDRIRENWDRL